MGVDHYMVCQQCRSAWQFFRSQAGGFFVDPSLIHKPANFWAWMSLHRDHGITVIDEHGLDELELAGTEDYRLENRLSGEQPPEPPAT